MALYGRNTLWEGKGTIRSCIVDGNSILYDTENCVQHPLYPGEYTSAQRIHSNKLEEILNCKDYKSTDRMQ
jgi:hypothetical protein